VTQAPRHRRTTFDEDPDTYAAARRDYPTQVYRALVQRCGLGPGTRVLEIGPGTGQATRHLLAAGAHVTAVELGPALAGRLRRDLGGTALTVVEGDFATVTVPDAGFDLGACATAWHWLDPAVAVGKLGRAVRPGGWLAVWWTVFADPDAPPPWRDGLDALFARHLPDQRREPGQVPRPLQTDARIAELPAGDGRFAAATSVTSRRCRRSRRPTDPAAARPRVCPPVRVPVMVRPPSPSSPLHPSHVSPGSGQWGRRSRCDQVNAARSSGTGCRGTVRAHPGRDLGSAVPGAAGQVRMRRGHAQNVLPLADSPGGEQVAAHPPAHHGVDRPPGAQPQQGSDDPAGGRWQLAQVAGQEVGEHVAGDDPHHPRLTGGGPHRQAATQRDADQRDQVQDAHLHLLLLSE